VLPRIVNGVPAFGFPAVGALLRGTVQGAPDTASAWCSGTLIGCTTFLTAAHCVAGRTPGEFWAFVPNAGIFAVTSIAVHPSFDFPAGDVAVLTLAVPVNGVAPTPINTTGAPPFGSPGTIVGFGRSGGSVFDYGLKRAGSVITTACSSIPSPGSDTTSVCWNFEAPIGPPGSNANTCNADSGGPLLVDFGAGNVVAGTTSGGTSVNCLPTDSSYDANVYTYRSFVETEGGADLANTTCGTLPQVGSAGATVLTSSADLSAGSPAGTFAFEVPTGATLVRVAMNAIDDGLSDFDLYVKAGSPPTTLVNDCKDDGTNQFAFCELNAPTPGPWHVLVNRVRGAGTYQLTVTIFATDCAGPTAEGQPCNDGNVCTENDSCQGGVCTGSVVPDGTPCDDGQRCTRPDTCQAGTCTGNAPALGCKQSVVAGAAWLQLANKTPDSKDRLTWGWRRGAATSKAEFGDPTAGTDYTLCLFDETGSVPQLILEQRMPAGNNWAQLTHGFRYRDPLLGNGGISGAQLREGARGKATITVTGKGPPLSLPALPLHQQPTVTMQLMNGSQCWAAAYSRSSLNSVTRFKAKSD
jgi:hypothetical protein